MQTTDQSGYVVFTSGELRDLRRAKALLENPGLTARLANLVGGPLEKGFKMLPAHWALTVNKAVRIALLNALDLAVGSIGAKTGKSSEMLHKVMVGASGGLGGAFGLPALPVELPLSTTIMLRSIADVARSEGHDLQNVETKLSCLEV